VDASKMTRDQLKKTVAAARKQKVDLKKLKGPEKALKAFRDSAKALAELAKKNPND
jgi:hypothetical protein